MNPNILKEIDYIPHNSGVYLMKNIDNTVIYVGKAKDLFKRVSQYFLKPQTGKVAAMVNNVHSFEYIVTNNDKEALVLEMNLIHKYYPRYNILLKDGKHYPYISLSKKGNPVLKISRSSKDNSYYHFGPYPNSMYANSVIDLLNSIYPFRKCKNIPKQPCLYYHIGQCLAPCINKIDYFEYKKMIDEVKRFLDGDYKEIYNNYRLKMENASKDLNFELANECKKILISIKNLFDKQIVEFKDKKDRDFVGFSYRNGYLCIALLTYKNGVLLGTNNFVVENSGDIEEQVANLITQYYSNHEQPNELYINGISLDLISPYLDCNVTCTTKGRYFDILSSAKINASKHLDRYFISARLDENNNEVLEELASILNIEVPYHIELFDNSHIQGDSAVGAMVAYINGEPNKKLYRKFNIKESDGKDDLESMREITTRHYTRLINENRPLPNLILADGGANQLKVITEVIKSLDLKIPCFGLFKNDKHATSGIIDVDGNIYNVDKKSKLFYLLTRMQDEIHRFAITFHRNTKIKKMFNEILSDIDGLGKKRLNLLLEHFETLDNIKTASLEDLKQLLPENVAISIFEKFNK